jgi:hypothetical protein
MSARRLFPYVATLVLVLGLAAVFVLRPSPFIGVTGGAIAASLGDSLPAAATASCKEAGEDEWTCDVSSPAGPARTYDVTVNGFGCWTATPAGGTAEIGTPATITGCITVFDH